VPRVLVVDDEPGMRDFLALLLEGEGYEVATAADGGEALRRFEERPADVVISDIRMPKVDGVALLGGLRQRDPSLPVIMITAHASADSAIQAMKLGAIDYITKPFQVAEIKLVLGRALAARAPAGLRAPEPGPAAPPEEWLQGIVGRSHRMIDLYKLIGKVSEVDSTVLITGESGTGKTLVARTIHLHSPRADRPFLAINCGAIPSELLESELFGHVKGAFTGAVVHKAGLFEVARGGTVLLDEVTDMSLALQVKLLHVLQGRTIRRVGGTEDIGVDVRVIAATNKDPLQEVARGLFREDLFYRLNVIPIHILPLRERKDDILPLARHFLGESNLRSHKTLKGFTPESERLLLNYPWPGNVRELHNLIERLVILGTSDHIEPAHLPVPFTAQAPRLAQPEPLGDARTLAEVERGYINQVMQRVEMNKSKAAKILGISRQTLRKKLMEE